MKSNRRLAVISTVKGYAWAGSEELWLRTALLSLDLGHQVSVVVDSAMLGTEQVGNLRARGATVIGHRHIRSPRLAALRDYISPRLRCLQLRSDDCLLISLGSPLDLIHFNGLAQFLTEAPCPYVLVTQFNSDLLRFTSEDRQRVRRAYDAAHRTIFVSEHNRALLQVQLCSRLTNAVTIPNPIRDQVPHALSLEPSKVARMAVVARLDVLWKGHDILFQVLQCPHWSTREYSLSLFGSGPDESYLRSLADHLGIAARIHFQGYVRSLEAMWGKHDICVLPSRGEGLALAMLEAMACGRPVVCTAVGGARALVSDGETGFLAETPSVEALDNALERAWHSRDQWHQIGLAAQKKVTAFLERPPERSMLEACFN